MLATTSSLMANKNKSFIDRSSSQILGLALLPLGLFFIMLMIMRDIFQKEGFFKKNWYPASFTEKRFSSFDLYLPSIINGSCEATTTNLK